jgi:metallo-beta-lactamase family protein
VALAYNDWFSIHPDVDVLFRDSGHILGSANVTIRVRRQGMRDTVIGFSGDIGRPNRPILRDPAPMDPCDYMICESTYGNKLHKSAPAEEERLLEIIKDTCEDKKGKLIIPAFSVGRTQEIVHLIDRLENEGKLSKDLPIFVDSPLAVDATEIFRMHPECFDEDMLEYLYEDPDPFGFKMLRYVRKVEDSKKLNTIKRAIIISASGMITAGRIKHHVANSIDSPNNTILIVGYCAPYTIGAQLASGKREIRIFGEKRAVKCEVAIMNSFSAHGDRDEMIDWLGKQDKKRLRNIFLVHGDPNRQEGFQEALEKVGFDNVTIPELGESFKL